MPDGGIIAGALLGAGATAVEANQQKIADQKQRDALADAQKAQQAQLDQQAQADAERKAKEAAATQQAFASAASNRKVTSAAALPGAVPDSNIGNPGNAAGAAKTLIGG